jgi:type II secretory pathway component GspD/PulD (secretin)/tetratricopeptide (TPR) repeat protein
VFFDRFGTSCGPKGSQSQPADPSTEQDALRIRRRRIASLGLAVAMATPAALLQVSRLYADEAKPAPSDAKAGAGVETVDKPVAKTDAPADAPKTDAKPDAPAAAPAQAEAPLDGRGHYLRGRDEYRKGDWVAARKDFDAAVAAGYAQKPSAWEDAAGTYLARMNGKEGMGERPILAVADPAAAPETAKSEDPAAAAALSATARAEDLRRQQAAAQATQLVKEARGAENEGRLDEALNKYAQAVRLDPSNAQAQAGYDNVLTQQGKNPRGSRSMDLQEASTKARVQEITYRFDTSITEAVTAINNQQWDVAEAALQRAQLAAGADRNIFSADALRRFDQTIANTRLALDQARTRALEEAQRQREVAVVDRIQKEQKQAAKDRDRTLHDLRATARDLMAQARYREAIGVVDQILVIDPTDDYAVGMRPTLEDKYQFQVQKNQRELLRRTTASMLNSADERMIPYDDILRYPTDWPDISATRDQTVQQERGEGKEDRAVQAQLDRQLPELQFDGVGFADVIDFLRDVSGANVFVNWKSLEGAGIDRNAPVTAKLRNVKFSKALGVILDSVGGGATKLGYTIDDGVITISTSEDLSKNTITQVYDIRDLIINIPDFTDAPDFSLNSTSNNGQQNPQGGGGIGAGGGGGQQGQQTNQLFGNNTTTTKEDAGPTRQELVEQITKLITETVAPDSWRDAGGSVGAVRELQGQLIVTQTPENQRSLVNLLEKLRETRAIQVTVETRFLTVQRNFMEDVGVDLNFIFNTNGSLDKNFSTIPVQAASSAFTLGPTTSVPGSIGNKATALTTAVTYLDDFQVNLMLRATQASVNSTFCQAPRVTLFNGQRAYVLVATQQAYVSNLTANVGTGVATFSPTVSIIESGVILDVTATVSADRKYVTLTLRPQLSTLLDLASFTFQVGAGTAGGVNLPGVPTFGTATPTGTIQEPELQITEVKTTVSIPDGGTLLLGGQTIAGEITKEVGVPILSKIPFLKRLTTNQSMAKDEQILLILVKPTIIIEKEIEQKQFPLLTSKLGGG